MKKPLETIAHEKKTVAVILDIDGVLLDLKITTPIFEIFYKAIKEGDIAKLREIGVNNFNKDALNFLHKLVADIEEKGHRCVIVISSSWRTKLSVSALKELFKEHKFSEHIIDKTLSKKIKASTRLSSECTPYPFVFNRGEMIDTWLQMNATTYNIEHFLIIDDMDDGLSELFSNHFVHCQHGVFSEVDYQKGIQLLGSKKPSPMDFPLNNLTLLTVRQDNTGIEPETHPTVPIRVSTSHRHDLLLPLLTLYLQNGALAKLAIEYDSLPKPSQAQMTPDV